MKAATREKIAQLLRRRTRWQWIAFACAIAIVMTSVLDHAGAFGYPGDDWKRFDQKSFKVTRCINGDTIVISRDSQEVIVHLLGVDSPKLPDDHWAENAAKYTAARTV